MTTESGTVTDDGSNSDPNVVRQGGLPTDSKDGHQHDEDCLEHLDHGQAENAVTYGLDEQHQNSGTDGEFIDEEGHVRSTNPGPLPPHGDGEGNEEETTSKGGWAWWMLPALLLGLCLLCSLFGCLYWARTRDKKTAGPPPSPKLATFNNNSDEKVIEEEIASHIRNVTIQKEQE